MRIDRLFEMVYLLLERPVITAKELAQRFEVSERTVYRDVETLSMAGVPVYTHPGKGGGIGLMEGYVLNRTALSASERSSLLFALQSLRATRDPEGERVLRKLGSFYAAEPSDWIGVDFTPWGSGPKAQRIFETLKEALITQQRLDITYINARAERSQRQVDPVQLQFKGANWYLVAYCLSKDQLRTFRLSRILQATCTGEKFDRSAHLALLEQPPEPAAIPTVHLELRFSPSVASRLYDEYADGSIKPNDDGSYTVHVTFPEDEWVYGHLLSFGSAVQVISPERVGRELCARARKIMERYES